MPQFTPERGYEYPCYSDPNNFPAQMQAFAEDVDADVQTLVNDVNGAQGINRPAFRISRSTDLVVANNVDTDIVWVDTAVAPPFYPASPSATLVLPNTAIYLIALNVQWANNETGFRRAEIHRLTPSDAIYAIDVRSGADMAFAPDVFVENYVVTMVGASAGTTFECRVRQNSGGNLTVFNASISITELSQ